MIFSAENEEKGQEYVRNLVENYHYREVSAIHSITTIEDLYRLYLPKHFNGSLALAGSPTLRTPQHFAACCACFNGSLALAGSTTNAIVEQMLADLAGFNGSLALSGSTTSVGHCSEII